MRRNHPKTVARLWLFTDERVEPEAFVRAAMRLPRGSGIIFRHHGLEQTLRRALFDRLRKIARRRRLMLMLAGPPRLARAWGADGAHVRIKTVEGSGRLRISAAAHDVRELKAAGRSDMVFLSPVFATRSHPGARPLGRGRFATLARLSPCPVIALGGMNRRRHVGLKHTHGWAAIDALTRMS